MSSGNYNTAMTVLGSIAVAALVFVVVRDTINQIKAKKMDQMQMQMVRQLAGNQQAQRMLPAGNSGQITGVMQNEDGTLTPIVAA
jgi:hypothetical protein